MKNRNFEHLIVSQHALRRMAQRGFSLEIVRHLYEHGRKERCRGGACRYRLTRSMIRGLRQAMGRDVVATLEGKTGSFIVVSDGTVLTVARPTRRLH